MVLQLGMLLSRVAGADVGCGALEVLFVDLIISSSGGTDVGQLLVEFMDFPGDVNSLHCRVYHVCTSTI